MSERPFMQLYVSDFIGDTLHLSTEQIGAYMLLLMAMWNAGGKLPNDDAKLARVVRMSVKKWNAIKDDLLAFFDVGAVEISHNRLTKELQKSERKSQSRADAGAKGGTAKALKDKEARVANAMPELQHLPDTRDHIEKEEPIGSSKKRGSRLPADFKPDFDFAGSIGVEHSRALTEFDKFRDYWNAKSGKDAAKLDWQATWRNWIRNARPNPSSRSPPSFSSTVKPGQTREEYLAAERRRSERSFQ